MTGTPLDILAEWLSIVYTIQISVIAISAAGMGYAMGKRIDSLVFCLAIAAVLFFFSSGFMVALIGFNPLKIVAVTLVFSRCLKELFYGLI